MASHGVAGTSPPQRSPDPQVEVRRGRCAFIGWGARPGVSRSLLAAPGLRPTVRHVRLSQASPHSPHPIANEVAGASTRSARST